MTVQEVAYPAQESENNRFFSIEKVKLNEEVIQLISNLLTQERELATAQKPLSQSQIHHALVLAEGKKLAKEMHQDQAAALVSLAYKEGDLVGFSLFHLDDTLTTVKDNFLGVKWQEKGQLIGVSLLLSQVRELYRMGITSFEASVWEKSKKTFYILEELLATDRFGKLRLSITPYPDQDLVPGQTKLEVTISAEQS